MVSFRRFWEGRGASWAVQCRLLRCFFVGWRVLLWVLGLGGLHLRALRARARESSFLRSRGASPLSLWEHLHRVDAARARFPFHSALWLSPPTGGVWLRTGGTSADVLKLAMRFHVNALGVYVM